MDLQVKIPHNKPISLILVGAQFLLIALLVSPVHQLLSLRTEHIPGTACLVFSIALGIWALLAFQMKNFSVFPEPVTDGQLIKRGPYRFLRHPMYSAVLLACVGACLIHASPIKVIWLLALLSVLIAKINREESLLLVQYSEYAEYRTQTSALVPGLY